MKRAHTMILLLGVLAFSMPASAEEAEGPSFRLTLRANDVVDDPVGSTPTRFVYPHLGISVNNPWLFVDASTPMLLVIVDGLFGFIGFVAGVNDGFEFPMLVALNSSDRFGAWLPFYELSGGPQIAHFGEGIHVGVGGYLSFASLTKTSRRAEDIGMTTLDLASRVTVTFEQNHGSELMLSALIGNGWHEYGGLNPFVGAIAETNLMFHEWAGVHIKGQGRIRWLGFSDYTPRVSSSPAPEDVPDRAFHVGWTVEIGPVLRFE